MIRSKSGLDQVISEKWVAIPSPRHREGVERGGVALLDGDRRPQEPLRRVHLRHPG